MNIIERINALNTTNTRILDSIGLANFVVVVVMVGVTIKDWEPSEMQFKVLIAVGALILTMMGFDVIQFASKRFSDAGLAAAKNPTQPVATNVIPEQSGDTKSAPSSLSRTLEQPIPVLGRVDADVVARVADASRLPSD